MSQLDVTMPEDKPTPAEFEKDGHPGVCVINAGLVGFEPKAVFGWQLSLLISFDETIDQGLPSADEVVVLDGWETELDAQIKHDTGKPNALFLARVTWNGSRELVYRIHDPRLTDAYLAGLIDSGKHLRPFDYRIEPDETWDQTRWYLDAVKNVPG